MIQTLIAVCVYALAVYGVINLFLWCRKKFARKKEDDSDACEK